MKAGGRTKKPRLSKRNRRRRRSMYSASSRKSATVTRASSQCAPPVAASAFLPRGSVKLGLGGVRCPPPTAKIWPRVIPCVAWHTRLSSRHEAPKVLLCEVEIWRDSRLGCVRGRVRGGGGTRGWRYALPATRAGAWSRAHLHSRGRDGTPRARASRPTETPTGTRPKRKNFRPSS